MGITKTLAKLLLFTFVTFFAVNCGSSKEKPKDYIIVLDTSMSMVGKGGKNVLPQVKKGLNSIIDRIKIEDSFSFITFDTKVKFYPTIYINDENDKDILKKYVSIVEAKGLWTYFAKMRKEVWKHADSLEQKSEGREQIIFILTDALDDPPPGNRKDDVDIEEYAKKYEGKDWIFIIADVGASKENYKAKQTEIKAKKTSKYTKTIKIKEEKNKDFAEVIGEKLDSSVKELEAQKRDDEGVSILPFIIALIVVLLVLGVIWYLKKIGNVKLCGILEYWDHTAIRPEVMSIDMSKLYKRKIRIGKKVDCDVLIRDFDNSNLIVLEAANFNGVIKNVISSESSLLVFEKDKKESFLIDGDVFAVGDFTFKFIENK